MKELNSATVKLTLGVGCDAITSPETFAYSSLLGPGAGKQSIEHMMLTCQLRSIHIRSASASAYSRGGAPWSRDPILIGIQWLFCMHSPMEQKS